MGRNSVRIGPESCIFNIDSISADKREKSYEDKRYQYYLFSFGDLHPDDKLALQPFHSSCNCPLDNLAGLPDL
jgi:hypothetical protein